LTICGCGKRASLEKAYAEARLQFQQGFADQPLQLAETSYKESTPYPDLNWKFRVLTAEARARKGLFAQALELLQPDPPADAPAEVFVRRRLAQASSLCQLGNYKQAEERLAQAAALAKKHGDERAAVNYARGRCEMARHDWRKAEGYLRSAAESDTASDPYLKAYALASLGGSIAKELRYEEAIDWYSQCLPVAHSLRAPPLEQLALGNLGFLYAELRDFPNARKNSEEAEKIASKWKILRDQQKWLLDIGFVQSAQGLSGAAEESYKRALAIATQLGDTDVIAKCLHNLTRLKLNEGQSDPAEKYHRTEADLGLKGDNLLDWKLDQADIDASHGDYDKAVTELKDLLQQVRTEDAERNIVRYHLRWLIQSHLARVYTVKGEAAKAEKWFQSSIDTVEEAAKKMKRVEFSTAIRDNLPVFDGYVTFLINHKREDKALQVAQEGRGRTLMQNEDLSRHPESSRVWLAKIQGYLRRNKSVLFSYFATEKECYLWAITATQFHLYPLGMPGPNLDNLIDSYHQEIQQHLPLDASPAAKKLFQVLVQPAIDLAPPGSHVVVVADSKIYSLNFETLIASKGADHYWIEDVDIQNTSSIDLLVADRQRRAPVKGLLLIGAPAQADPHFPELPHAPQEMESVRKHFLSREVKSFSGRSATPDSYINNAPGSFRFIHLATHGTPNALEPLQSAIILSAGSGGKFKLLGQDIVNNSVHLDADLVTISACEGVGTNVQSLEGLLGLEWAFMRAGAHQVVAALWDMDDTITPGLMDDFYGQMEKGQSAADALRHAKLALLHAGGFHAAPYYWGALQLYTRS
jgi:CHAT domain-containing protein/Tfp pilus assembly protein PilF